MSSTNPNVYSPHLVRDSDCALCRVRSSLVHPADGFKAICFFFPFVNQLAQSPNHTLTTQLCAGGVG